MRQRLCRAREKGITGLLHLCFVFSRYGLSVNGDVSPVSYARRFAALALDWGMSWAVAGFATQRFLGIGNWILVIFFCEVAFFTALTGQSAGQRILGLRIVTWSGHLPVSVWAAILRTIALCLVIPPLITDGQGRGLHDRWAHTTVVRVR